MNIQELDRMLISNHIPTEMYSLTGGLPSESYCIEEIDHLWHVYYSERGIKRTIGLFDDVNNAKDALLKEIRNVYPHLSPSAGPE